MVHILGGLIGNSLCVCFVCKSQFQTGNVVQLVSRTTGKPLQILMSQAGQLVVDGNGPLDPSAFHSQSLCVCVCVCMHLLALLYVCL